MFAGCGMFDNECDALCWKDGRWEGERRERLAYGERGENWTRGEIGTDVREWRLLDIAGVT